MSVVFEIRISTDTSTSIKQQKVTFVAPGLSPARRNKLKPQICTKKRENFAINMDRTDLLHQNSLYYTTVNTNMLEFLVIFCVISLAHGCFPITEHDQTKYCRTQYGKCKYFCLDIKVVWQETKHHDLDSREFTKIQNKITFYYLLPVEPGMAKKLAVRS